MKPPPTMPDHYATLGVDPTARATTIRAAYLALMREYHPDRNPSPEAVARAQAAVAAFKVLGDFDRRNHYDWDRRREREAVAALAEHRPRRERSGALAAGAIGLAAVGAWAFMPPSAPEPIEPQTAEARPASVEKARPASPPKRVAVAPPTQPKIETPVYVPKVEPRPQPVRVAKIDPPRPKPKVERTPVVRVAAAKAPTPRPVPPPPPPPPPRLAKAVAKPVQPAATPATDLASLDQFVMNFYGQSWRHGDAPKRAALVQSRDIFVARRGSCAGEACKRAAYLKLMRDVSQIVETGQPRREE